MSGKTKEKEKTTTGHKIFTVLGIVLCVILVPILVMNVTMIIQGYVNPDKVPSFGGYSPLIVLSRSMEDTIMKGDLVIIKTAEPEEVKEDDIISFFDPDSKGSAVLTHRCLEVIDKDGKLSFRTKGDNNDSADPTLTPADNLVGKYITRIPNAGSVAMWLQTTPGLIVCVAVPIVLLIAYDLIMKKRYDKTKKKDTDELLKELEELRAKQGEKDAPAEAQPAEKAQEAPAEKPVEKPAEQPAQKPVETSAEQPAEAPARELSDIDALINEIESEDKS